ncbi:MAG: hypothetical protein OXN44_08105 [Acidimicrobiaceae bacterium]|nr:hypothetical protein [Acidimicrobiaceae bacterium]MDE0606781.1 hypothetical protein [Acidimicrobiaceae bacterium]MDE0607604.1 hypothetical protein [Acidimicrobiaceae bacterium]
MNDEQAEHAAEQTERDSEVRDSLPGDLDPSAVTEPYLFPNNSRRRIPALLYAVIGAACILASAVIGQDTPVVKGSFVNNGVLVAGIVLILVGLYHAQAGWDLSFDEEQALQAAARDVGFPVGHASAQLGWRGLRSRPTWKVLLYSNEPSPKHRGLVLVDGIDGEIIERFVEQNPEDWTDSRN